MNLLIIAAVALVALVAIVALALWLTGKAENNQHRPTGVDALCKRIESRLER